MYSRVYVEITNICNRSCSFCPGTKRPLRSMTLSEFDAVTDRLCGVTEYIYYHVMGEPLTHPELPDFIRLAKSKGFKSAITTNGTLLPARGQELIEAGVYKVNISVHSFEDGDASVAHGKYLDGILDFADEASKNGVLTLRSSVLVSMTMAELSQQGKVTVGVLRSNDPALFITGVADGARAITDVLALRGGELTNLVLSAITGVSGEVSRFCSVYPMDINGDGVTEVPRTVTLQGEDADHAVSQRVDWISYDASGTASRVLSTYHDVADGWYLQLPEGWPERVWVGRSASPDEIGITFYTDSSREESYVPVLRITALSGSERERLAVRTGRFILGRNDGVIYVGELLKGNQDWKYSVTEDEVRASFSLIGTEWSAGDN